MTDGEKAIWAAAFVAKRNEHGMPPYIANDRTPGVHEKWQRGHDASAAEYAAYAVINAREALPEVEEGWGNGDKVHTMLVAMLDGTPNDHLREAITDGQRAFNLGLGIRDAEIDRLRDVIAELRAMRLP